MSASAAGCSPPTRRLALPSCRSASSSASTPCGRSRTLRPARSAPPALPSLQGVIGRAPDSGHRGSATWSPSGARGEFPSIRRSRSPRAAPARGEEQASRSGPARSEDTSYLVARLRRWQLKPRPVHSGRNPHFCLNTPTIAAYPCVLAPRATSRRRLKPACHAGFRHGTSVSAALVVQAVEGSSPFSHPSRNPCI